MRASDERFGADVTLDSITVRDAEEWRQWLATQGNKRDKERDALSDIRSADETGVARQIFATAFAGASLHRILCRPGNYRARESRTTCLRSLVGHRQGHR